jgi:hypothetical protein
MALNRLTQLSLVVCALFAFGCGDDDGSSDGDNPDFDAAPDQPDAGGGGPSQTGRIVMGATTFQNFEGRGEGLILLVDVRNVDERVPPAYEEAVGSPFGCKATEFTPEQYATPPVNFGTLSFTITDGPPFPDCNWVEGAGYLCVGAAGSGGDLTVIDSDNGMGGGVYKLTNAAVTFGTDQVGRMVKITGAAEPKFNAGLFPITAATADSVTFVGPPGIADPENGTAASYQVLAGFGPALQADPVSDDSRVMAHLTAGGDGTFEDFDLDANIGDSFTMDDDTAAILSDLPLDGSAFSVSCEGTGGTCNQAMANGLIISTTDGDVTGLPPFALPAPATKATTLICLQPGGGTINVPAAASAYLMNSGATRLRAIFIRANVLTETQSDGALDFGAGHAWAGFTTP